MKRLYKFSIFINLIRDNHDLNYQGNERATFTSDRVYSVWNLGGSMFSSWYYGQHSPPLHIHSLPTSYTTRLSQRDDHEEPGSSWPHIGSLHPLYSVCLLPPWSRGLLAHVSNVVSNVLLHKTWPNCRQHPLHHEFLDLPTVQMRHASPVSWCERRSGSWRSDGSGVVSDCLGSCLHDVLSPFGPLRRRVCGRRVAVWIVWFRGRSSS